MGLAAVPVAVLAMRSRDPVAAALPGQAMSPAVPTAHAVDAEAHVALAPTATEPTPPAASSSVPEPFPCSAVERGSDRARPAKAGDLSSADQRDSAPATYRRRATAAEEQRSDRPWILS